MIRSQIAKFRLRIGFYVHLPVEEVVARLQERHAKVVEYIDMLKTVPPHCHGVGIDISIQHRIALLECDERWLSNTIEGLKNGTIPF